MELSTKFSPGQTVWHVRGIHRRRCEITGIHVYVGTENAPVIRYDTYKYAGISEELLFSSEDEANKFLLDNLPWETNRG